MGSSALLALASHLKLKLKLQYFGHLKRTATSLEKVLMLGQIEGRGSRQWRQYRGHSRVSELGAPDGVCH